MKRVISRLKNYINFNSITVSSHSVSHGGTEYLNKGQDCSKISAGLLVIRFLCNIPDRVTILNIFKS
jgi:hypothetical protein